MIVIVGHCAPDPGTPVRAVASAFLKLLIWQKPSFMPGSIICLMRTATFRLNILEAGTARATKGGQFVAEDFAG